MRFCSSIVAGLCVGLVVAVGRPALGDEKMNAEKSNQVWVVTTSGVMVITTLAPADASFVKHRVVDASAKAGDTAKAKGAIGTDTEADFTPTPEAKVPGGLTTLTVVVRQLGTPAAGIEGQKMPGPEGKGDLVVGPVCDARDKTCVMTRDIPVQVAGNPASSVGTVRVSIRGNFANLPPPQSMAEVQSFFDKLITGITAVQVPGDGKPDPGVAVSLKPVVKLRGGGDGK